MNELERFKTEINLVEYAAVHGYTELDRNKSSKTCVVLRRQADDGKIAVVRGPDRHWVYYDFRQGRGGSVLDFVMQQTGYNLGQARQKLRGDSGSATHLLFHTAPLKICRPSTLNRHKVAWEYDDTLPVNRHHPYLASRRIHLDMVLSGRFSGMVRVDSRMNICFPYFNFGGLAGLEKRNRSFTGYSKGGSKGLWRSCLLTDDRKAVICESPIDALSYAEVFTDTEDRTRYFATGGQISRGQWKLIDGLVKKYHEEQIAIVLAFDNDSAGKRYVQQFLKRYSGIDLTVDLPQNEGQDWNDVLLEAL